LVGVVLVEVRAQPARILEVDVQVGWMVAEFWAEEGGFVIVWFVSWCVGV